MKNNKKIIFLGCLFLLINLFVYYPSFSFIPRADQIDYLVQTVGMNDLGQLLNFSYSYNRTRYLDAGDFMLFRPVNLSFLSLERWLWGYNFTLWQITGFVLHCIILIQLLWIMNYFRLRLWAFLLILYFSVLPLFHEMVTWHHIHGYLLFLIFFLQSFIYLILFLSTQMESRKHCEKIGLFLLLACFTYEFGVLVCLSYALFLYLWVRKSNGIRSDIQKQMLRRVYIMLGAIPLIYILVDVVDYLIRLGIPKISATQHFNIVQTVIAIGKTWALFLTGILFPGFFKVSVSIKMWLEQCWPENFWQHWPHYNLWENLNISGLVFAGIWIILKWRADRHNPKELSTRQTPPLAAWLGMLLLGLSLLYVAMISAGRLVDRGFGYITYSLYHFYIIGLLFYPGCILTITGFFPSDKSVAKGINTAGVFVLLLAILISAHQTRELNCHLRKQDSGWRTYFKHLERFVSGSKDESGFSFIAHSSESQKVRFFMVKENAQWEIAGPLEGFLFGKYWNPEHPKYYLVYTPSRELQIFDNLIDFEKTTLSQPEK